MLFRIPRRVLAVVIAVALVALVVGVQPPQRAAAGDGGESYAQAWSQPLGSSSFDRPKAVSPDGSRVYVAWANEVEGFDTTTHLPVGLATVPTTIGRDSVTIEALTVSSTGVLYALSHVELVSVDKSGDTVLQERLEVERIDFSTGTVTGQAFVGSADDSNVNGIRLLLSSDGAQAYAFSSNNEFDVIDTSAMKVAHSWRGSYDVWSLFAVAGGVLGSLTAVDASGTASERYGIVDPNTDRLTTPLPAPASGLPVGTTLVPVGVQADGQHLVGVISGGSHDDYDVVISNLADASRTQVAQLPRTTGNYGTSALSSDGSTLFVAQRPTAGDEQVVTAVNLDTGAVQTITGLPATLEDTIMGTAGGGFLYVADVADSSASSTLYEYSPQTADAAPRLIALAQPKITDLQVGETASVTTGTWSAAPGSMSYQWYEDFTPITGATGPRLAITPAMFGHDIYAVVVASSSGYADGVVATQLASSPGSGTLAGTIPTITGQAKLGSELVARPGSWTKGSTLTYQWSAAGVAIPHATASTFTVTLLQEGKTIAVTVTGHLAAYTDKSMTSKPTAKVPVVAYHPSMPKALAGSDRYATAIAISKDSYPKAGTAKTVFVTSGENFPDALSAAPAAVKLGGPLLLTPHNRLPSNVAAELKRLKPKRIVVVGGTAAVSSAVTSSLAKIAPTTRISGADRYATSLAVAKYAFGSTKVPSVYIATGTGFADALSAGARAGHLGAPVVLVPGASAKPSGQLLSWLKSAHTSDLNMVGGYSAISWDMQNAVVLGAGLNSYTPYAGTDRFDTNRQIVSIDGPYDGATTAYIASGMNFPDALAGAAAAGKAGVPLYLTQPSCVPAATVQAMKSAGIATVKRLGGAAALGSGVARMTPCG